MTRLITISSVLIIIFSFAAGGIFYLKGTRKVIDKEVVIAIEATEKENKKALTVASDTMLSIMQKRHSILSLYVRHEELEEIEEKITVLCEYGKLGLFDEAKICITEIDFLAKKIYEREILTLDNLF